MALVAAHRFYFLLGSAVSAIDTEMQVVVELHNLNLKGDQSLDQSIFCFSGSYMTKYVGFWL